MIDWAPTIQPTSRIPSLRSSHVVDRPVQPLARLLISNIFLSIRLIINTNISKNIPAISNASFPDRLWPESLCNVLHSWVIHINSQTSWSSAWQGGGRGGGEGAILECRNGLDCQELLYLLICIKYKHVHSVTELGVNCVLVNFWKIYP